MVLQLLPAANHCAKFLSSSRFFSSDAAFRVNLTVQNQSLDSTLNWLSEHKASVFERTSGKVSVNIVKSPAAAVVKRPTIAFVLGGPGVGKGTQCSRIQENFGYVHLSAGELLRQEQSRDSPDGELIDSCIRAGKIVPVAVTIRLLIDAITRATNESQATKFLVDGFPRNFDNFQGWRQRVSYMAGGMNFPLHEEELVQEAEVQGQVNHPDPFMVEREWVLFFNCSENTMKSRLVKRGMKSGRSDDNEKSVQRRLVTFRESTVPVVQNSAEWTDSSGCHVYTVNCESTADEVWGGVGGVREVLEQEERWAAGNSQRLEVQYIVSGGTTAAGMDEVNAWLRARASTTPASSSSSWDNHHPPTTPGLLPGCLPASLRSSVLTALVSDGKQQQ